MKQLLVLSGKGGTGKTTVTTLLIQLLDLKKYADCDVDAPNLHLSIQLGKPTEKRELYGLKKAFIVVDNCINCGLCQKYCRFDAIYKSDDFYKVDPILCEGCSVCSLVCPKDTIQMIDNVNGTLLNYQTVDTFFTTAALQMGSGNSGFLVSEVKNQLKHNQTYTSFEIIDGSPGIGCPVIASITGVDLVLVVAEPSVSGYSDMKRVIQTAKKMKVPSVVCVNKYDINPVITDEIISYCQNQKISFVGKIPFDKEIAQIAKGKKIDIANSKGIQDIYSIIDKILPFMEEKYENIGIGRR
jgi:MinD superfamily P-loop ATPase